MPKFLLLKELDDSDKEFQNDFEFDDNEDFEEEKTFHDSIIEVLYEVSSSLGVNGDVVDDDNFEFFISDNVNVLVEFGYSDTDYEITVLQDDGEEIDATTNTSAVENRINDLTLASMIVSQVYDELRKVLK